MSYIENVEVKQLPRILRQNQAIQHSEGSLQLLFTHIAAALGFQRVEDMARSSQQVVDRFNRLIEIMAESRLLELEITSGMFGMMFSTDQTEQMKGHIEALRRILRERDGQ